MKQDRRRAGMAVEARMGELGLTARAFAEQAAVDVKTVRSLITGERWPQAPSRGRMEAVLKWPAGTIATIAAGETPPVVGGDVDAAEHEDAIRYQRPPGLSDAEWDERKRQGEQMLDVLFNRAIRDQ